MICVSLQDDRVRFDVEGWDKRWSFNSQLELEHEHYQRLVVEVDDPAVVARGAAIAARTSR